MSSRSQRAKFGATLERFAFGTKNRLNLIHEIYQKWYYATAKVAYMLNLRWKVLSSSQDWFGVASAIADIQQNQTKS